MLLKTYDQMNINIYNDWNFLEKGDAKGKVQFINLLDYDGYTTITFETVDRKIVRIVVSIMEEGC